jgi:PAS domain S-box-containing protein
MDTNERLLANIVRRSPDAIVFADREGVIRWWNAGAEALFGHAAEAAIGETLDLIIPPNLRDRHWSGYREVMRTGKSRYGRELLAVPALHKNGSRISLEFSVALIEDDTGAVAGVAAILRDVTERRRREKEMKDRLAALEKRSPEGGGET